MYPATAVKKVGELGPEPALCYRFDVPLPNHVDDMKDASREDEVDSQQLGQKMDFPSNQLNTRCTQKMSYMWAFIKWMTVNVVLFELEAKSHGWCISFPCDELLIVNARREMFVFFFLFCFLGVFCGRIVCFHQMDLSYWPPHWWRRCRATSALLLQPRQHFNLSTTSDPAGVGAWCKVAKCWCASLRWRTWSISY